MHTGELIKQARIAQGLTQADLAERLNVTPQAISQYERGVKNPKIETVKKIATALCVPWFELYSGEGNEESKKEIESFFGDVNEAMQNGDYKSRVESAAAYLLTLRYNAGYESDTDWKSDEVNSWLREKLPEVAKLFNVTETDLDDRLYWEYAENEEYLSDIHEAVMNKPIRFRSLEKICRTLMQMNDDGQALAADRVEELAQIPKYQKDPAGDSTQSAGAGDENDPE